MNARESAYFALISFEKEHMEEFFTRVHFSDIRDGKLAKEIAYGTVKRLKTLEYWAKELSNHGKLLLKRKEKLLLYSALYQHAFLDRVPPFAINDETVKLAHKQFGSRTASFFNALLRKAVDFSFSFPAPLESAYSYPPFFIAYLEKEYGLVKTKEVLDVMNSPFSFFARDRLQGGARKIGEDEIPKIAQDKNFSIQNITPVHLVSFLHDKAFNPKNILDLCASPGGKLLHAHDLYPEAELFANDVSEKKCVLLKDNLQKYGVRAELSCARGEEISFDRTFDLILLDVPCSNSGVLHKRPEARWRLSQENIQKLKGLQLALIQNALRFLSPQGRLWYFTCSILKEENEEILRDLPIKIEKGPLAILPNHEGWDGGFACSLTKLF